MCNLRFDRAKIDLNNISSACGNRHQASNMYKKSIFMSKKVFHCITLTKLKSLHSTPLFFVILRFLDYHLISCYKNLFLPCHKILFICLFRRNSSSSNRMYSGPTICRIWSLKPITLKCRKIGATPGTAFYLTGWATSTLNVPKLKNYTILDEWRKKISSAFLKSSICKRRETICRRREPKW